MACRSALSANEDEKGCIGAIQVDDVLIQKTSMSNCKKSVIRPEDVEIEYKESSNEDKQSCTDDNGDSDEYDEEDTRFLDVSMDGDIEDLVQLLEEMAQAGETLSVDMLNCADSTGRVPVSYLCGNGMIEMLELVEDIPGIEYNTPDTEGMTPLHFAAQAGHVEVVTFLLNKVRTIQVDPINLLGFTPLMKAAIQGRVKCSKLLLISGASSSRRDYGRGYTAPQWARYLNRDLCAESMEKFVRTAAVPGVSLSDILADPRALMKDIEKSSSSPSRSKRRISRTKLKDMLKKKSSFICNKIGGRKQNVNEAPLAIETNFGSGSFVDDLDDVSSSNSKSWLTKALKKVLKVPSGGYNNNSSKPLKQTLIEDQSLGASPNGYPDMMCDEEDANGLSSKSDNIPLKTSESYTREQSRRTSKEYCDSGDKSKHGKHEKCGVNYFSGKKKCAAGNSNCDPRFNEYSNTKPNKRFAIPEIRIIKIETLNYDDDESEDSS